MAETGPAVTTSRLASMSDTKRQPIGSDLKKVDAYVLGARDYDEIPELTDEDFARGVWRRDGKPVRGNPRSQLK